MLQGGINLRAEGVSRRLEKRRADPHNELPAFGEIARGGCMAFDREPGDEMDDFGDELFSDYQEEEGTESEGEESVGDDDEDLSYEEVMVAGTNDVSPAEEPKIVASSRPEPAPAKKKAAPK